ncbi:tubulin polyglutamylase complex subunit 1 isoform X2 [Lingula anatina]|uniref:Tubulin polyglutamylase complex subunit 1 isoform X2 n=1 Tax=Lingula anatina TaxID=7574 RepID=A0A1S3HH64_LINAN|nr:tubulin polyglutamylase complex subunit 1 isoform X2 [Lingula anatina]|eukprot:XP_013385372.1 tubulin polyglutamylase complex subunit 1 isoform X2 [Lingula anatina]
MAEKRKTSTGIIGDDRNQESDRHFLERTSVNNIIKDMLAKVLENRPANPVVYIAEYFENLDEKSNKVTQAHRQLLLTHHSRPAFENNVRQAYESLGVHRANRSTLGVNGLVFTELLQVICRDFPEAVKEKVMKKLACRDWEVVTHDVFRSAIFTCFVLKDFLQEAESLYWSIDLKHNGEADKVLCDAVLHQILIAVSSSESDPKCVMDAGYSLAPDRLYMALNKVKGFK